MFEMSYNGFSAKVMEAERLTGEHVHGLPPGSPLNVYPSDSFVSWPNNWMKGPGVFLIPVRVNKGIWFDWRNNCAQNTAIIPTIKGCNPYTGLPTSGFHLEHYSEKCPKHGISFIGDRFCSECNYKWPPQNYIGPGNIFWLDGWLNPIDGTVRQFFFTEDMMRDVAQALIGAENTVPAFGFAFYRPKELRKHPEHSNPIFLYSQSDAQHLWLASGSGVAGGYTQPKTYNNTYIKNSSLNTFEVKTSITPESHAYYSNVKGTYTASNSAQDYADSPKKLVKHSHRRAYTDHLFQDMVFLKDMSPSMEMEVEVNCVRQTKEVAVGAGAKITQSLNKDPYELDSWKDTPDAVMTIYFVFHDKFEELRSGGMRDLDGKKEGMLAGLPVG